MAIDPVSIKERVVVATTASMQQHVECSPLFSPEERDFILHSINTYSGIQEAERKYPPKNGPESSVWANLAWVLIDDNVPAYMLSDTARYLIAGLIAGALKEVHSAGQAGKKR